MADWEESKPDFIAKLESADKAFDEIFKVDRDELVIQGDERKHLSELQEANRKILEKIKRNEFSVSIVGLEKAGKSTLGNALIKSLVLPEDAQRCTYTTTEIRAGEHDVGEVQFYSREEFNKNFKRMLKELEYPDADKADFFTMTEHAFTTYWEGVEADPTRKTLFHAFDGDTVKDIEKMLKGKQIIEPLLGQSAKHFGSDCWDGNDFNEFKTYVTGIAGKDETGNAIRQPHPYAVKNIIIRSSKLADMSHMVLYDVPGFDSPTELHKKQTEEMLRESDAIILVTNVGDRPNLTGPQLDMLRKGHDSYDVKLADKVFVFGNKIDRAPDASTSKTNLAALRNDAVNNHIARGERVIGGSARAYLERLGKMEGDVASKIIDGWGLEQGDGVAFLYGEMQTYYDQDRFAVLQKRAETTLSKTRDILRALLGRYNDGALSTDDASAEVYMEIRDRLREFIRESKIITDKYTKEIALSQPFSISLKDKIKEIYPLAAKEYQELIKDEENLLAIAPGNVYQTTTVNGNVRNRLHNQFVANTVEKATLLTGEKQQELRHALVESFLKIMGLEEPNVDKESLAVSVNELFDKMLIEGGKTCNFNSLVERFASTAIETLILCPFGEEQRRDKVKELLPELVSLSVYYNLPARDDAARGLRLTDVGRDSGTFFAKILAHEGIESEAEAAMTKENETYLKQLMEENKPQLCNGAALAIDLLPLGKWAKILVNAGINLAEMSKDTSAKDGDKFKEEFEMLIYKNSWEKRPTEERKQALDEFITSVNAANKKFGSDIFADALESLHEKAKAKRRMENKEDMIAALDADIEILRDITAKSVINAIGLERAFIAVVVKNVELIRKHLQEGSGAGEFNAWIRRHAQELMPSRFTTILTNRSVSEKRRGIVNAVKGVLDDWKV